MLQFVAIAVTDLPATAELNLTLLNSDGGAACWSNGERASGATGITLQGADDTPFALRSLTVTSTTIALVNGDARSSFDIFSTRPHRPLRLSTFLALTAPHVI